jgi:streptogramin lyase
LGANFVRTASEEKRKTRSSYLLVPVLFCLAVGRLAAQTVTEFPIPNGFLSKGITTGPDGNIWFAEYSYIGRITPSGVITTFLTPTPVGHNTAITAGPDGNLWYTVPVNQNVVGRISPSGVITEFAVDDPTGWNYHSPLGITAGPDGNLWFAETPGGSPTPAFGNIGRITPSGQITQFSVPSAGSSISYIAQGPDGNLWFTESSANQIGRITTAGAVTEFSIPTPASNPLFIAAGPDGNIWFTESNAGQIGRITPAGVVTEFPLPPPIWLISLTSIAAGPDGNLWFTEFENSTVGRITPAGVITEFSLPTWRNPYGITTGPDGNLWLTEGGGPVSPPSPDLIARFTLPSTPPPPAASFYTLAPCRVIDTRNPAGPYGGPALISEATRVFSMAGQCGIPTGATAIAVNIAVTQPISGPGFLTMFPAGGARPLTSVINFRAGQTRANNAILPLSGSGGLSVYCQQGGGTTHFILDVTGYFQ